MRDFTKHLRLFLASLVAAGWLAVIAAPAALAGQHSTAGLARAIAAQELYTADLMAIPGVVGTAVGLGANGDPVVKIYTVAGGIAGLPSTLDGVGVRIEVTGEFFALHHRDGHVKGGGPGNGDDIDPKARFARPVPIGVSSGTTESIETSGIFISCSTGTLGARLTDGANPVPNVYALSNNHVYAEENAGVAGDSIVQPGPADNDPVCSDGSLEDPTDSIGTLAAFVDIVFDGFDDPPTGNLVDGAIALVGNDEEGNPLVGTGTPADGYGIPKSAVLGCDPVIDAVGECANLLGVNVQKYGRTTGLKTGSISAINATMLVGYGSGVAQFVNLIIVNGDKGAFIKGGDSGSLLVVNGDADDRKPVGLLFAGPRSGKTALAIPIELVLDLLGDELGPSVTLTVDGEGAP